MKLIVNNSEYSNFLSFYLNLEFDSFASTFNILGVKQQMPRGIMYKKCKFYDDDDNLLLTGQIINYSLAVKSKPQQVRLGGYSTAGILEDVNMPLDLYPIHLNLMSLNDILERVLGFFKIDYVVDEDVMEKMDEVFLKTNCSPDQSIKTYIAGLASERDVIITHDQYGVLHFTKLKPQRAVHIDENSPFILEINYRENGQTLHNPVSIIKQVGKLNIGDITVSNPFCNAFRPTTKIMKNGFHKDLENAAKNYISSELKSIKIYIKTTKFFKPGTLIALKSETLGFDKPLELFVENIRWSGSAAKHEFSMSCIPKAVYYDVDDEIEF